MLSYRQLDRPSPSAVPAPSFSSGPATKNRKRKKCTFNPVPHPDIPDATNKSLNSSFSTKQAPQETGNPKSATGSQSRRGWVSHGILPPPGVVEMNVRGVWIDARRKRTTQPNARCRNPGLSPSTRSGDCAHAKLGRAGCHNVSREPAALHDDTALRGRAA